jgi:hypothetical protein
LKFLWSLDLGAWSFLPGSLDIGVYRKDLLLCASTAKTMMAPVSINRLASGTALMLRIFSR